MFTDEGQKVSAALTHFKMNSPAGEWAKDLQDKAFALTPVDFGTWNDFKTAFKKFFVPPETELESANLMHGLRMGSRPFNEWYQEWSTHANRANVDERTKMYAFRKLIPEPLHAKLLGLSPPPDTLTALVEKSREFDRLW